MDESLDHKTAVDVFYLDISKAFDTVSHPKLLQKIEKYGITSKFLNWIKNFLLSRSQQVRVDGTLSENISVISGVPQGSVLGPLLFLMYINDLARVIRCSSVKMFADDTKIYFKTDSDADHALLCSDVEATLDWMCRNQLSVASEKCSVLHLGNRFINSKRSYTFNGDDVPSVSSMKDSGITVDNELNFSKHISQIAARAFQRTNLFFRVFKCRDRDFLLAVFKIYIRPLVEYCSSVWNPYLKKDITLLERVQKRYTKRIPGLSKFSYPERLNLLGLESLELRRLHSDISMCYKILNGLVNIPFEEFFSLPPPGQIGTRAQNSRKLFCKFSRLECRKHFFGNSVVPAWNSLPESVVSASSIECFRSSLRRHDLQAFLTYIINI